MALYSNLPTNNTPANSTVQAFDAYYSQPLELDASTYTAMVSFFTSRGFEKPASENIAVIIMKQAKIDNFNPMVILDTLRGLDSVEMSAFVSEIINYNRFKTSFLGYALNFTPNDNVIRNVEIPSWNPYPVDPDDLSDEIGFDLADQNNNPIQGA
jgi:hypothetical protein